MSLGVEERRSLRALASPVRLRILSLVTGQAMSAAEISRELGIAHASASYHVRQLAEAGLLELAEERDVRGGKERRYRHDPATGDRLGGEGAPVFHEAMVTELRRRLHEARPARPSQFTDAELWVPPDVWRAVCDQVQAAMTALHDAAQPPHAKGAQRVSATVALFRMGRRDR